MCEGSWGWGRLPAGTLFTSLKGDPRCPLSFLPGKAPQPHGSHIHWTDQDTCVGYQVHPPAPRAALGQASKYTPEVTHSSICLKLTTQVPGQTDRSKECGIGPKVRHVLVNTLHMEKGGHEKDWSPSTGPAILTFIENHHISVWLCKRRRENAKAHF